MARYTYSLIVILFIAQKLDTYKAQIIRGNSV